MTISPCIISVAAGECQLPLLKRAQQMGYRTVAIDHNPRAPGFTYADVCIRRSTHDTEAIVAVLRDLRGRYDFKGVVARTTAAEALYTAVALSEEFGLPGLTGELVKISTEKSALREFCNRFCLPVPMGTVVEADSLAFDVTDFPVIVKPDRTSVGKANIRLCRESTCLVTSIADAKKASSNLRVEVESFVEGIDATCLCWAYRGKAVFLTWWDELVGIDANDGIVGLGVSVPSVIEGTSTQQEAEQLVARLVHHFPIADALLLVSFRITKDGSPYIIEVHADLGGDLIADVLLPTANLKFDFFELAIKVAASCAQEVERFSMKPTTLYCCGKVPDPTDLSYGRVSDHILSQRESVKENLTLLHEIVRSRGLDLSVWPQHIEWSEQNSLGEVWSP